MINKDELQQMVEKIEHCEAEIAAIASDKKEFYAEAKSKGYNTKILRKIIAKRKQPEHERSEEETMMDLYMQSLGMLPLFEPAQAAE